jgi:Fic/DOC family protein
LRWMGDDIYMSSRPRAFLENMRPSRRRRGVARTLSPLELEEKLDEYAGGSEAELNRLRDQARALAPQLDAEEEFTRLDELIGALHGTREGELRSPRGRARRAGLPYDATRLVRFEQLQHHLLTTALPQLEANPAHELSTFAFFESYFSNFIEGTEFTVEEAERIVFEGEIPQQRPQDAHDILGTYGLVAEPNERGRVPSSADELVEILRSQHATMLRDRPEIGPGQWKTEPNRAGTTFFVDPELVEGTLREGFRFYDSLPPGFPRACFAMFLVSEVHPFADGNGRAARLLMNSELTAASQQRIIVPTAARDDYLYALRGMTHNANAASYVALMRALQQTTYDVDFSDRRTAELYLRRRGAFDETGPQPGMFAGVLETEAQ